MEPVTRRTFIAAPAFVAPLNEAGAQSEAAPPRRNLLSRDWTESRLAPVLQPRGEWRHFPVITDRTWWDALPSSTNESLRAAGERQLGASWPVLPASVFLDYRRNGNRSRYEAVRNARRRRLQDLLFAECVENQGRFLDEIANGLWTTCEETYWGVPAHVGVQKAGSGLPDVTEPTVDLFGAETAAQLAWTDFLLADRLDRVSPLIRPRIRFEVHHKVLDPNFTRNDFWWMGLDGSRSVNNWNPWICSNWLAAALWLEEDERRRVATVHKILTCLDRFLDGYHPDGGCDEGPGYWGRAGASLFENLELLHSASNGKIDFFSVPLVGEIGHYIGRAHIAGDWYINFADASARIHIDAPLVYRYGKAIHDEMLMKHAAWSASQVQGPPRGDNVARQMGALLTAGELAAAPKAPALIRDVWFAGIEVFAARLKEGEEKGLYLAAQGGHNAESHNHNDIGNFIVFASGRPALVDAGVETYTAKTFSSQRYDIWTMQSAWHNCPTVNGLMQGAGRQFEARNPAARFDDKAAEFSLDIAAAYPSQARLTSWRRTFRLDREANAITVLDAAAFQGGGNRIEFNLLTPAQPQQMGRGSIRLSGGLLAPESVTLSFDPALEVQVDEKPIEDGHLKSVWGDRLYRIRLIASSVADQSRWTLRIA
jgi:hypothetical protein